MARCFTDFKKIRSNGWQIYIHKELIETDLFQFLGRGIRSLKENVPLERVPCSDTAIVYRFKVNEQVFYYKEHLRRSLSDLLKNFFSNRAVRSLKGTQVLQRNGFNAPPIVCIGARKIGPFQYASFTVSQEARGQNIYKFWDCLQKSGLRSDKVNFITSFARIVADMHTKKIRHGDMRLGNVLVEPFGNAFIFTFLDNERTRKLRFFSAGHRKKNLVQINMFRNELTTAERLKFIRHYAAVFNMTPTETEELANVIEKQTFIRLRKKGRV